LRVEGKSVLERTIVSHSFHRRVIRITLVLSEAAKGSFAAVRRLTTKLAAGDEEMKKLMLMAAGAAIAAVAFVGRADAQSANPSGNGVPSRVGGVYGAYPSEYPAYPGQYPQQYPTTSHERRDKDRHDRRGRRHDRRDGYYDRGSEYGYGSGTTNGVPSRVGANQRNTGSRVYDNGRRPWNDDRDQR
jgi:hypothetical protein